MLLEDYLDIISPLEIRLKGTDVRLEQVVERYRVGYHAIEIRQELPSLNLEQIYGAITYYLHNREKVDAYLRRQPQQAGEPGQPIWLKSSDLSQRMRALFREHEQALLG